MKCTLCGCNFDETRASKACECCPVSHSCDLVKCPQCGFEMPVEPAWIRKLKGVVNRFTK